MEYLKQIRTLYHPIQPAAVELNGHVTYDEVKPSSTLRGFIYCYWQLKTKEQLSSPYLYRVVSDGCIDIFFNNHDVSDIWVMGFCKKFTEFPLDLSFDYVGIRFYPSIFPLIFKVGASSLANKSTSLFDILPFLSDLIVDELRPNRALSRIAENLDSIFERIIEMKSFEFDHRFYESLCLIMKNFGALEIETNLKTGLSPRQLRRVFNYYIGATPKAFSRVVRFQHILSAKPSGQSIKKDKLFYDAGFYDQAHFIKDFKSFYGVTPSQAFG